MFASNEILQFVMIAVNGIFLICAHATVVAANDGKTLEGSAVFGDFINRVWGDQPLQVMDFIFLGCAVILGLEILNRLVANSGCKYRTQKRVALFLIECSQPLSSSYLYNDVDVVYFFPTYDYIDRSAEYETYSCKGQTS